MNGQQHVLATLQPWMSPWYSSDTWLSGLRTNLDPKKWIRTLPRIKLPSNSVAVASHFTDGYPSSWSAGTSVLKNLILLHFCWKIAAFMKLMIQSLYKLIKISMLIPAIDRESMHECVSSNSLMRPSGYKIGMTMP